MMKFEETLKTQEKNLQKKKRIYQKKRADTKTT